jgi:formylglycine-generating enzyme required for sulfatase activity
MAKPSNDSVFDWIAVPRLDFVMGGGPRREENPAHPVELSPFLLARTQVTRATYQRFLDETANPEPEFWRQPNFAHPSMPAVGPSWHDAMAFCQWASALSGEPVRLPSEAEWECAAKAGRNCTYPWGEDPPESLIDYDLRWQGGPEPVDAYPSPHPLGFLGLGENVHEWCSDWFDADYYQSSPQRDPTGPATGRRKASRGGSWRHDIRVSRCAARSSIPPHFRYEDFGFRVARSVD